MYLKNGHYAMHLKKLSLFDVWVLCKYNGNEGIGLVANIYYGKLSKSTSITLLRQQKCQIRQFPARGTICMRRLCSCNALARVCRDSF